MKYKTFIRLAAVAGVSGLLGTAYLVNRAVHASASEPEPLAEPAPAPALPPAVPSPLPVATAPVAAPAAAPPTTTELRATLEAWLETHADRHGEMRAVDIFPAATYRATAVRFPPADAVRFSNDPSQWSQIRIDLDRNGVDDEKWLLRNGHTYKREILAADGRTVFGAPEYFR